MKNVTTGEQKNHLFISSLFIFCFFMMCTVVQAQTKEEGWVSLLDKELSKWRTYLSFEIKDGYKGEHPTDANGHKLVPLGYDRNDKHVFTTLQEDNDILLRVSGEIYGCLFTKEDFRNYHLKLKFKYGEKKWEPRLNEPLDSGILYHSQGEAGVDWWKSWMLSHEFQICEGTTGEYWCIGSTRIRIKARIEEDHLAYDPEGELIDFGAGTRWWTYCAPLEDREKPKGEWNELELVCYEGKSFHLVNGEVVLAISELSYMDEEGNIKPLNEGKIQLQSEAGEVFYKDIQIRELDCLPERYTHYF
ncbi:MAG: DUF1080 domain-containing protein [Tannerellaceae bacterium]|nr:DUF1080 domain-containing protein [Tannerellaceae bacterium]